MRYLMTFSYDGTNYYGYQVQPNHITIQQVIEECLTKINSNVNVRVHASGRTDASVHALNQTAHFDLDKEIDSNILMKSLNKLLPDDIYIKKITKVSSDFHARYMVKSKEYVYKINVGEYDPISRNYVLQYNKSLDINKMIEAIKYIEGTHDFRAFTTLDYDKDTVRTIYEATISKEDNIIKISLKGNGFLRYMVRNIVGTLIEIGEGKKEVEDISKIIASLDRNNAGKTAEPQGLYLYDVVY